MLVDNPLHPLHTIISLHFTPINPSQHFTPNTSLQHNHTYNPFLYVYSFYHV
ncbi:hypothetical protein Paride_0420 [Pseudomonas phage Paride]|nr:hypothetical protein Paride_0420 [Pseudomonas phage Paride]